MHSGIIDTDIFATWQERRKLKPSMIVRLSGLCYSTLARIKHGLAVSRGTFIRVHYAMEHTNYKLVRKWQDLIYRPDKDKTDTKQGELFK